MTRERYEAAARRHPDVASRVDWSIGSGDENFNSVIGEIDVFVGWQFPLENLAQRAPKLKWIHIWGAGIEHLLPLDWLPRGVALINNSGVHAPKAGEFMVMAILMLNNRIPTLVTSQHQAHWNEIFSTCVADKTLVIIGVGQMGGTAARRAKELGMRVVGVRRSGHPRRYVDEMYVPGELDKVLPQADFVLISIPLTRETENLIGRRELDLMKPQAGLINLSRAQVVDYDALAEKLHKGELSGAVLDVFDPEPLPSESPLWKTPNLIITPHVASDDWDQYMPLTLDLFFNNIRRFFADRPLLNRVRRRLEY
ncbi:MAG TPA: D-2-hydroxyacid dehydrogenase [Candidatus Marinimicrobia bacterium]|nr:D-2-hydroxyacid dehydrogenase [Candidatus Neomarinimicrobiota bacterium]